MAHEYKGDIVANFKVKVWRSTEPGKRDLYLTTNWASKDFHTCLKEVSEYIAQVDYIVEISILERAVQKKS